MKSVLSFIAIAALSYSNSAVAQVTGQSSTASSQCLTFTEALAQASRVAPSVGTATARLAESEAELMQARSLFRPQVSSFARTGLGDAGLNDSRIENQVGIRVSQRVFDFGDSRFAREAARAGIAASRSDVRAEQATAAETVGRDYLAWLEAGERLRATRERETYFEQQLTATEKLLTTGGATVSDRADIEAEALEAQSARIELEFLLERFATRLAINTRLRVLPCSKDDATQAIVRLSADLPTDPIAAATNNPRLEVVRRNADRLEAVAKREAAARFPVVSIGSISSYAFEDLRGGGAIRNRVGVDVSVPLYSGNAQTARVLAARARTQQARGRVGEAQRQLEEDLSISTRRVAALRGQAVRRDRAKEARAEQLNAAELQFERNLRTLPELIEVRLMYETALLASIETSYELLRQQLTIVQLRGLL